MKIERITNPFYLWFAIANAEQLGIFYFLISLLLVDLSHLIGKFKNGMGILFNF